MDSTSPLLLEAVEIGLVGMGMAILCLTLLEGLLLLLAFVIGRLQPGKTVSAGTAAVPKTAELKEVARAAVLAWQKDKGQQ